MRIARAMVVAFILLSPGCRFAQQSTRRPAEGDAVLPAQVESTLSAGRRADVPASPQSEMGFVSLDDCVAAALQHYRHPSGLHTVRRCVDARYPICILLPPGLDRHDQLVFWQSLQSHVLRVRKAYWSYVFASKQQELYDAKQTLLDKLLAAEAKRLESERTTRLQYDRQRLESLAGQIDALKAHAPDALVGTVTQTRRTLTELCGLQDEDIVFVATDIPLADQPVACLDCDIRRALCRNPDLVVERFQWIIAARAAGACPPQNRFPKLVAHESALPSLLPNTAFDLATQREQETKASVRRLRDQIDALEQGSALINESLQILTENQVRLREATEKSFGTIDHEMRAEVEIVQLQLDGTRLLAQLQNARDAYDFLTGSLLRRHGIHLADFWLTACPDCPPCQRHAACRPDTGSSIDFEFIESNLTHDPSFDFQDQVSVHHRVGTVGDHQDGHIQLSEPIQNPPLLGNVESAEGFVED